MTSAADVLDGLGAEHPPFIPVRCSTSASRLIVHNLDKTLLDRTVALASRLEDSAPGNCAPPWTPPRWSVPVGSRTRSTCSAMHWERRWALRQSTRHVRRRSSWPTRVWSCGEEQSQSRHGSDWGHHRPGKRTALGPGGGERWTTGSSSSKPRGAGAAHAGNAGDHRADCPQDTEQTRGRTGGGASSSTWPPTDASPLRTPTCSRRKSSAKTFNGFKGTGPGLDSNVTRRWSSVRPTTRNMRP